MNFEGTNFQSIAGVLFSLRRSGEISLNYKHSKVLSSKRMNFLAKYFSAKDSTSYSPYFVEMIPIEKSFERMHIKLLSVVTSDEVIKLGLEGFTL